MSVPAAPSAPSATAPQRRRTSAAGATHPGTQREVNEDALGVFPDEGLFIVADGMGGYAGGQIAAEIAVAEVERFFREKLAAPRDPWPFPIDKSTSMGANLLRVGMKVANASIRTTAASDAQHYKMGSTIAAIVIGETQLSAANVGDVRVYRLRDEKLDRISRDHSLLEEIRAASPDMSPEDLARMASRNVVTRALGSKDDVEPTVYQCELRTGDRFLLCCDGLWNELSDPVIEQILCSIPDGDEACQRLIDTANANGGKDNISAVLVRIE